MAFDISIKSGAINNAKYSILYFEDDSYFACNTNTNISKQVMSYVCIIPNNIFISNMDKNEYEFFRLEVKTKNNQTLINIIPKVKTSQMFAVKISPYEARDRNTTINDKSKNWSIYFTESESNLLFKSDKNLDGLDFNMQFRDTRPYIGTLDEDKKPLLYEENNDIKELLKIKKLYEDESYKNAIEDINFIISQNPESIFRKEYLLYLLRSYHKIANENLSFKVRKIAIDWLERYTSNENIPEVLFYLGYAYYKMSKQDAAVKIFQELIDSFPDHKFNYRAKIALADTFRSGNELAESIKIYEDVLFSTKDMDIALLAAERIAMESLDNGFTHRAKLYYEKIVNNDIDYLIKDSEKGYRLALKLISSELYDVSVKILDRILQTMDKQNDRTLHMKVLFKIAEIYEKSDILKAVDYYKQYIEAYPDGPSVDLAQKQLDRLIFNSNGNSDMSDEMILENIEYILKKYPNNKIALQAFYRKMNIFSKQERYGEVLSEEIRIANLPENIAVDRMEFLNETRNKYAISSLGKEHCQLFTSLVDKYKINIDKKHDNESYQCLFQQFKYDSARKIVDSRLIDPFEQNKILWLYRLTQIFVKNLDYENIIYSVTDLLDDIHTHNIQNKKYQATIYDLFEAYKKQKDEENVLKFGQEIDKTFKDDIRNILVFKSLVQIGEIRLDDNLIIYYGNEIKKLQELYNVFLESPWIDYVLLRAYSNMINYEKSIEVLDDLYRVKDKLSKFSLSKLKYSQSHIYKKMDKWSIEESLLKECAAIEGEDIWPTICANTLKWIK